MVENDCQKVDAANPSDPALDSMSFAAYLRSRKADQIAISTATIWTRAMLGQEPEDVSALYFLNYCKSGGGLMQMRSDRKHGGQYLRVRQGTQLFSKELAADLPEGTVRFNAPVIAITQPDASSVVVKTKDCTFVTRKVVSAVPLAVLKTIAFEPALPADKKLLTDSFNYGYYTKVMLRFKTPFWIQKGFCGLAQAFNGPAAVIRDCSVPSDGIWVLTCFMAGRPGLEWSKRTEQERTKVLLTQIGGLYQNAAEVKENFVGQINPEWSKEEYSGFGCPCPSLGPGVLSAAGHTLRQPFKNIHFAGTETAEVWKGYMEGAVRSGDKAGDEIVSGLKPVSRL
jgi:monoamine oxidase